MSDTLSQDEINELLTDTEAEAFDRKRLWILENIEYIKTFSYDKYEDQLHLDTLTNLIKLMKNYHGAQKCPFM